MGQRVYGGAFGDSGEDGAEGEVEGEEEEEEEEGDGDGEKEEATGVLGVEYIECAPVVVVS